MVQKQEAGHQLKKEVELTSCITYTDPTESIVGCHQKRKLWDGSHKQWHQTEECKQYSQKLYKIGMEAHGKQNPNSEAKPG